MRTAWNPRRRFRCWLSSIRALLRPSGAASVLCLAILPAGAVALACAAPERPPPERRPPAERRTTTDRRPPHDPFPETAESHIPPGAECGADSDCTLQTHPDPDKDGCCPHWCGRPVVSVARAKELAKTYAARCPDACPPHDCAGFDEREPRCEEGRCVGASRPRSLGVGSTGL